MKNEKFNCNINVVDTIMGGGKTSAAINFINSSDDNTHFLYITPYLDEVQRIISACHEKHFIEPKAIKGKKMNGLKSLISKGSNVVSTHSLFKLFDRELIDICRANNYTLIMDEVADVIEKYDISSEDFELMKRNFVEIDEITGFITWRKDADDYKGKFSNEKRLCDLNCLVYYGGSVMMWLFPIEAFNAFRNIYVLTYMFDSQIQRYYYDFYGIHYNHIYITGNSIGTYSFSSSLQKSVDNKYDYKKLIHILEDEKLNRIGDTTYDLSKNWYVRNNGNVAMMQLKNNIVNYFIHKRGCKTADTIWTTFKDFKKNLTGKGYGRGFIPLNARSSNQFRNRTSIAYPVNRYVNTGIKNFLHKNGVEVDEDGYALSEMLQFIWRSAIRDGHEIWVYIPSIRMRTLLENWIVENSCETNASANDNTPDRSVS